MESAPVPVVTVRTSDAFRPVRFPVVNVKALVEVEAIVLTLVVLPPVANAAIVSSAVPEIFKVVAAAASTSIEFVDPEETIESVSIPAVVTAAAPVTFETVYEALSVTPVTLTSL
jgi:hypothetical protein